MEGRFECRSDGAGEGSRWGRRGAAGLVLLALALLVVPTGVAGQQSVAAPYLVPDHWVRPVLRRLDGLGLLGGEYAPGLTGVDRVEAARLLAAAAAAAERDRPELVPMIDGYRVRFGAEFPVARDAVAEVPRGPRWGGAHLSAGFRTGDGEMLTSVGTPPIPARPWVPEEPAGLGDDAGDALLAGSVSGYWSPYLAAELGAALQGEDARLLQSQLVAAAGPVRAWAGRRRLRIGHGDGGIIVSGALPVDGGGVATVPFRLPWALERLGRIRVATSLGRLERTDPYDHPWLWLFRASLEPHPRLLLGLNRAAVAVTVDGDLGDRLRQIAYVAIGKHGATADDNMRDNQMASVDLRYRPPLEVLPLTLYLEWGFDDSAGSWKDVPGIVGGAYVAAVPGAPWLGAGVERAHFAERCCGNIWWYRHSGFTGGWTDQRRPLGHPLGGHGDEWSARLDATLLDARALVEARGYWRDRGDENLFAPTFQGESLGGSLELSTRWSRGWELGLGIEYESGERDWSRLRGELQAGLFF